MNQHSGIESRGHEFLPMLRGLKLEESSDVASEVEKARLDAIINENINLQEQKKKMRGHLQWLQTKASL